MREECPCCGERRSIKLKHLKYEERPGNQCRECGCVWDSEAFISTASRRVRRRIAALEKLCRDLRWALAQNLMAAGGPDEIRQNPILKAQARLVERADKQLAKESAPLRSATK